MRKFFAFGVLLALTIIGLGCGSNSSSNLNSNAQPAAVFMTGEDAPLASVVGFMVTLNSVTLNGQDGSAAPVITTPVTVDFARLVGLRAPLAFNSVPPGTYVSATFVLASPMIDWVDWTASPPIMGPPIAGTFPGNQNPFTLTVNFPQPMKVSSNELAGLRMEMDIKQSVAVDPNTHQVTGAVNPVIHVKATKASDPDGHVTDLGGGLVSVNTGNDSFVLQGPYGRQLTVDVNANTNFNSGWNINNLAAPAFVAVQGRFQGDGSLLADSVEVVTTAHSFVSGRVLQVVNNNAGQAQQVTMWVGETGADMVNDVDTIQTFDISAVSTYEICFLDGILQNALFNNTSVEVGQRIFIGGSFVNPTFTPTKISLRRQGFYGTFLPGTVTVNNGNAGNFEISNNGLIGFAVGGPVTVNTFNFTNFADGLTGLDQLQTTTTDIPLIMRGLFLKNPATGVPQVYAGKVADPPAN